MFELKLLNLFHTIVPFTRSTIHHDQAQSSEQCTMFSYSYIQKITQKSSFQCEYSKGLCSILRFSMKIDTKIDKSTEN